VTSVAGGYLKGYGLADVVVGAPDNDALFSNAGAAHVLFGPSAPPAFPSYRTRYSFGPGTTGDARPARFRQARAVVDFTAGALNFGEINVSRHLFDPCDTGVRAGRPIWEIDSSKVNSSTGSSLNLTFKYTTTEVAASEEAGLLVMTRPAGNPCGPWTQVPIGDITRDAAHNRISATLTGVTSLGWFTLAPTPPPEPDTIAPETQIDSGPTGTTSDSTPTFGFTASEGGSTFKCSLDGGPFIGCTSPTTTAELPDGFHTFAVAASDPSGNTDPSPAARAIVVDTTPPAPPPGDTTPPEVFFTSGPAGLTNDATPTFEFASNEAGSLECRTDGAQFTACSSPTTTAVLTEGSHAFEVRATDTAGNRSTVSRSIEVDTSPPDTTLAAVQKKIKTKKKKVKVAFSFGSSEARSSFECSVDNAAFASCDSPFTATVKKGKHTFRVRATDRAGNVDASPASADFTVKRKP
jgi:hypothetical protein